MNTVIVSSGGELPTEMVEAVGEAQRVPPALGFVVILLCVSIGLVCVWNPAGVWEIRHAWDTVGGEPSRFYLVSTRISGAALVVLGIAYFIASFFD